ncbi:hypothetical protein [Tepidicaulis sp.]|jgi:hypothetical protein|uniref:hypothetical protein n=1 Tax=Tepidicaulis sp. TaxID=1920809 RepID=UPI003B5968DF
MQNEENTQNAPVKDETDARQAVSGTGARIVLALSLTAAVIVMALIAGTMVFA